MAFGSFILAACMGAASVYLFTRAWMSLLAGVAGILLAIRRTITVSCLSGRLFRSLTRMLLHGLLLVLAFRVYLSVGGFGKTQTEQLAYLIGCLPGMILFMKDIVARIDTLFKPDRDQ